MGNNANWFNKVRNIVVNSAVVTLLAIPITTTITTTLVTKVIEKQFESKEKNKDKAISILSDITSGKREDIIKKIDELRFSDKNLSILLKPIRDDFVNNQEKLIDLNNNIKGKYKKIKELEQQIYNSNINLKKFNEVKVRNSDRQNKIWAEKNINLIQRLIQKLKQDKKEKEIELSMLNKNKEEINKRINENLNKMIQILLKKI